MKVDLEEVIHQNTQFHNMVMVCGRSKTWKRCRKCRVSIRPMTPLIAIYQTGGEHIYFHANCAFVVEDFIYLARYRLKEGPADDGEQ